MAANTTINLAAASRDIVLEQGASVEIPFSIRRSGDPYDMSNFVDVRLQVRRTFQTTTTIVNATLANGKMVWVNQALGQFKFVLEPTDTSSILFKKEEESEISAVYDIEMQDVLGEVFKGMKGNFTILREVTR